MKKFLAVIMTLVLALSLAACGESESVEETAAINVETAVVSARTVESTVTYNGTVCAAAQSSISALVSGNAKEVCVELGDEVKEGQTLLKIDDTSYRLAYNQALAAYNSAQAALSGAQAQVGSAEAGVNSALASQNSVTGGATEQTRIALEQALSSAQSAYDTAKDNYDRMAELYELGAVSKVTLDSAETAMNNAKVALDAAQANYDLTMNVINPDTAVSAQAGVDSAKAAANSAQAGIESAKAGVAAAKAALDIAANALSNTTLTAPISGIISAKNVSEGQMVAAGAPAFEIKDTSSLYVEIGVTEAVIPTVRIGDLARVSISASNIKDIEGRVSVVNPTRGYDGMYTVRVAIDNASGSLRDGMFAEITLVTESVSGALCVPANALLQSGGETCVYVVNGSIAERRAVEASVSDGEYVAVTNVKVGETVVTVGKEYLSDENSLIKIVE